MQILFPIGAYYPSQTGGPNNTIFWMARALVKNDIDVVVTTTMQGIVDAHQIPATTWINRGFGKAIYVPTYFHYLPFRLFYLTWIQLLRADVVHLTAIFYPLSWLTAFANNMTAKKPLIWSPRGELDPPALMYSRFKKNAVLFLIKKIILPFADVTFHATCDAETEYIKNTFGDRCKIIQIPNYIELPELQKTKIEPRFLYIGRIHPKKAIENLVQALALSDRFLQSEYKLIIAGDCGNDYGDALKELVCQLNLQNKVDFIGHISGIEKQKLLASAYFSFMPSHSENFGNVVVEALAQGTPVVASKGSPWDILEKYKAGFWIENNPRTLATCIDNILLMKKEQYLLYRQFARNLADQEFDVYKNIGTWIKVYKHLTETRNTK